MKTTNHFSGRLWLLLVALLAGLLAGCGPGSPAATGTPDTQAAAAATDTDVAPTIRATNTPLSLAQLRTMPAAVTVLPTMTQVLQPTSQDLGIVATTVAEVFDPPTPTALPVVFIDPTARPVPTTVPVIIAAFSTTATEVDGLALANRGALVPVSWTVQDRPAHTNLYFEQVLPDGQVLNVELPRHFVEIPSVGSGHIAPYLPAGNATDIRLRLRVADMAGENTAATRELRLPVVNLPTADFLIVASEQCYDRPFAPSYGITVGARGIVSQNVTAGLPLTEIGGIGGRTVGGLQRGETFTILDGPFCFYPQSDPDQTHRQWQVRSELTGQTGWAYEYSGDYRVGQRFIGVLREMTVYPADQCFDLPFLPDSGLRVGYGARLNDLDYGLSVISAPETEDHVFLDGELTPDEIFTIIGGPHCYRQEPAPAAALGLRQWQVRSEQSGLTGWLWEYSDEHRVYIVPVTGEPGDPGGPPAGLQVHSFDVQPRTVNAGAPLTITWAVSGVHGVSVEMCHAGIMTACVPLEGDGALLPLTGSLTVNAPLDVTAAQFTLFERDYDNEGITVAITCTAAWLADFGAQFCPTGAPRSVEAAYQPFENGYMLWREGQILAVFTSWRGSQIYADTWNGGEVVWAEEPPDGLFQPERGFGTVWVTNESVRQGLGWATAPEQGYTMQIQQSPLTHRPGMRGGYTAADAVFTLPNGQVVHGEMRPDGSVHRME